MTDTIDFSYAVLLRGVDMFAGIGRLALAQLTAYLETVDLEDGEVLFHQGDAGDALYIVADGSLAILIPGETNGQETHVNTLNRGQFLGEMALVTGEPRSATVRSLGHTRVLRLANDRFLDLIGKEPTVARSVMAVVSQRLRAANQAIQQRDVAIRGAVGSVVDTLPSDQAGRLMFASLMPGLSAAALEAVFDEHADEVRENLDRLTSSGGDAAVSARQALRERLEREASPEEVADFLSRATERLSADGLWADALAVAARDAGVADVLKAALTADPPMDQAEALPWIEQLADKELAADPDLALLAAVTYLGGGRRDLAAALLRRALAVAISNGDATGIQGLTEALTVLGTLETSPDAAEVEGRRGRLHRPSARGAAATAATVVAVVCAVLAATVARDNPQAVFALLFASALALWNSNALPDFSVSLALVGAWMLYGIARPDQAVAGFATMDWIFVLAVLGFAVAVGRSGLLFRAGILLVRRSPARLAPQAAALMLTGVLLSPLLPEPRGRAALTAPLALAVSDAFRFKDREPAAALLGLSAWIGSGPLMFLFLNASPVCLLAWGLLADADKDKFDWLTWFTVAFPLALIVAVGMLGAMLVLFRPETPPAPSRERLNQQLAVLGPLTGRERVLIVILVVMVIGWFFAPSIHLHVGVVAIFGFFAAAAVGAFDQQSFREMDWSFLIYYGVALSMQKLSASLAVGPAVTQILGGGVASGGEAFVAPHPWIFIAAVVIVGFLSRLFLEASQAVLLLSLVFFPAAAALGISQWLVAITLLATNNPWLTEKQTPAYQLAYVGVEGRLYSIAQGRLAALAYMGVTLVGLLALTPYWRWLGLL